MDMNDIIKAAEATLSSALQERSAAKAAVDVVRKALAADQASRTADEVLAVTGRLAAADSAMTAAAEALASARSEAAADATATALQSQIVPGAGIQDRAPAQVLSEPRTYSRRASERGEASYFRDFYYAQKGDRAASDRIERHAKEAVIEDGVQSRAGTSTSMAGLGSIPAWVVDEYAWISRTGRPVANLMRRAALPPTGMTINVTRTTTGASAAVQATQNSTVSNTDQVNVDLNIPVVTISGQQQISYQAMERGAPGLDMLIYGDLVRAHAAALDSQVLNGSGSGGEMQGLRLSGGTASTAFGAAATVPLLTRKIAGGIGAVSGSGDAVSANAIIMHPRRWAWMTGQSDTTGRPFALGQDTAQNAAAVIGQGGAYSGDSGIGGAPIVVGTLAHNLPVITDGNVVTNAGTLNEDHVYVIDSFAHLLWEEGNGLPRYLKLGQAFVTGTVGSSLTETLAVYSYAAFTAQRYPLATAIIGGVDATAGQGLIPPVF